MDDLRPKEDERQSVLHRLQQKTNEIDALVSWRSCCLTVDKRAALFISQLGVGITIIGFCIGMLVNNTDCATFSRWGPLLTFVIGVFLPAPRMA